MFYVLKHDRLRLARTKIAVPSEFANEVLQPVCRAFWFLYPENSLQNIILLKASTYGIPCFADVGKTQAGVLRTRYPKPVPISYQPKTSGTFLVTPLLQGPKSWHWPHGPPHKYLYSSCETNKEEIWGFWMEIQLLEGRDSLYSARGGDGTKKSTFSTHS